MAALEQIIAAELASWSQRPVEHAIFGHADPARIARELERCGAQLSPTRRAAATPLASANETSPARFTSCWRGTVRGCSRLEEAIRGRRQTFTSWSGAC